MTEVRGDAETGPDAVLDLLDTGSLEVTGRLVQASNATFVGRISTAHESLECVYKPVRGERPLWDFPSGTLAGREVAAFLVSELAGWRLVPPTVLAHGPVGAGMLQAWVDVAAEPPVDVVPRGEVPDGWLGVLDAYDGQDRPVSLVHADLPGLRAMALFDVVINNAERKGGHILPDARGRLLGCDHGVSFHVEDKLRTVLWGWAGEPLTAGELATLTRTRAALASAEVADGLLDLIAPEEHAALLSRIDDLLLTQVLPGPGEHWPSIPWPAF